MSETKFPEGAYFNRPHENAPSFIKGKLKIDVAKFVDYLVEQEEQGNNVIVFDLAEGRPKEGQEKGNYYMKVDEYGTNKENGRG